MRTLRGSILSHSSHGGEGFKAQRRELIERWLKEYDIENYTINDDFTIDVKEDIDLDLRDLVEQQIRAGLDERQQRIEDALNAGVETSEIKQYENTIDFLDNIQEDALSDESDKGEKLRKNLIFQDFINRGFSKERASREVQRSLDSGTDIDDAKEALKSNLEYFKDKYDNLIKDAQAETKRQEKERMRHLTPSFFFISI